MRCVDPKHGTEECSGPKFAAYPDEPAEDTDEVDHKCNAHLSGATMVS